MSVFSPNEYFARLHRVMSLLDDENIKILQTMKEYGPRNLRQVAEKSGISYSTVYGRVSKLQNLSAVGTWIHPNYRKIGLARAMVLAKLRPGKESLAKDALKIPGYWLKIFQCTGEPNGYYTLHGIPSDEKHDFHQYLEHLVALEILQDFQIAWLGESFSPLPNFDYYDLKERSWRFEWKDWLNSIKSGKTPDAKGPRPSKDSGFDKKDLIILKEMAKDARVTLADLSKILKMTLPAAKYRYDRLIEEGYVADFVISVLPFIPESSDLCDVRLDFKSDDMQRNAVEILSKTPFSVTITPFEGRPSLAVRTYLPRSQMSNLRGLLASLAKDGILSGYSYLTLDQSTQENQTFAFKYYSDELGWQYDNKEYSQRAEELAAGQWKRQAEPQTTTLEIERLV